INEAFSSPVISDQRRVPLVTFSRSGASDGAAPGGSTHSPQCLHLRASSGISAVQYGHVFTALPPFSRTFWIRLRRRNLIRTCALRYQPRRFGWLGSALGGLLLSSWPIVACRASPATFSLQCCSKRSSVMTALTLPLACLPRGGLLRVGRLMSRGAVRSTGLRSGRGLLPPARLRASLSCEEPPSPAAVHLPPASPPPRPPPS